MKKEDSVQNDPVNRPSHYTFGKFEVIDVIYDWALSFGLGNCIKYIARAGRKDPLKRIEDLKKASFYLLYEIRELEKKDQLRPIGTQNLNETQAF